jgi:hypothetical protein
MPSSGRFSPAVNGLVVGMIAGGVLFALGQLGFILSDPGVPGWLFQIHAIGFELCLALLSRLGVPVPDAIVVSTSIQGVFWLAVYGGLGAVVACLLRALGSGRRAGRTS